MHHLRNCGLSGCSCETKAGAEYCSDYCRQAARHAPERDYCQCGHAGCAVSASLGNPALDAQLTEAISLAPGRVTIQCSSLEQLSEQLTLLAKAVTDHSEAVRLRVEPGVNRRPVASESQPFIAAAQHG